MIWHKFSTYFLHNIYEYATNFKFATLWLADFNINSKQKFILFTVKTLDNAKHLWFWYQGISDG